MEEPTENIPLADNIADPVELRHRLHQIPELMFTEFQTTLYLLENIGRLPGIKIHQPIETGFVVEYTCNENEPYFLFRADIDALPIEEETGSLYTSKNTFMHACGHDIHMSVLYGFLRYVVENDIKKNVLFLFQPGEEGGGGAEKIINSGILKKFNIKNAFALHVTDEYDHGTIASTPGVLFASAFELDVEFFGKSAHVAFPENGINAFESLMLFLNNIKEEITNEKEKIIFGYGKIQSGNVRNIVPHYAKIEATLRTLSRQKAEKFYERIEYILDNIKKTTGCNYQITKGSLYTEVDVDKDLYKKCYDALSSSYNFIDCGYKMTGEDFGFISKIYPSFMFWMGTNKGEKFGLHNPKFMPDDSVIETGISIFRKILEKV